MPSYFLTNKAVADLSNIWEYTVEVWSENQADKYYLELIESCKNIANNEVSGKNYLAIDNALFGLQVGRHIIFYRILDEENIEIIRFLHDRMDLKSRLEE